MKRFGMSMVLGISLMAVSGMSSADTSSSSDSSASLSSIVLCALGFDSFCASVAPDVTHDPTIVNN